MPRFDISRLRKENGMSQSELANLLQMTQSFLSAIENGKSPLPVEKEEKLREIFGIENLKEYILDKKSEGNDRLTDISDSDLINQLLHRFHKQAHSSENETHHQEHHQRIDSLQHKVDTLMSRIDNLMMRNDTLNADNDKLRSELDGYRMEIDRLRKENYELRVKLMK